MTRARTGNFSLSALAMFALSLFVCAWAGCGSNADRTASPKEVRIAAAANLKFVFDEITDRFHHSHPEIKLSVTYGSSGNFFAQLAHRAPFDLFLSADLDYPSKLVENGMAARESLFVYAVGNIVVWVPSASSLDLEKLGMNAVAEPTVRKIAIANPKHAPYGRAAVAAMTKLGVYETAKDRLVLGENIEQTAQFVHAGSADLGIIPLSLALAPGMRDRGRYCSVPKEAYPPIQQAGVVLSWANDKDSADLVRSFLTGNPGREILRQYGYDLPAE